MPQNPKSYSSRKISSINSLQSMDFWQNPEVNSGSTMMSCHNACGTFIHPHNCWEIHMRWRDSKSKIQTQLKLQEIIVDCIKIRVQVDCCLIVYTLPSTVTSKNCLNVSLGVCQKLCESPTRKCLCILFREARVSVFVNGWNAYLSTRYVVDIFKSWMGSKVNNSHELSRWHWLHQNEVFA